MADEDIAWDEGVSWDTPRRVTVTPGQENYAEDEALTAKYRGAVPDEVKTFAKNAGNAALFYGPRAASALYTSYVEDKPLAQTWQEEKALDDALSRQNPKSSMAGTAAGLVGGLAVPLGPIGTLGKAAEAAVVARGAAPWVGRAAEGATVGSTMSGVSGLLESGDPTTALKDAAIGAGVGLAAAPVLGALGNYFTKLPAVRDASGNLTREAERAIETAFKGKMTADDIASFKTELVAAFEKKGISPAVAREALLTKEGVTPTASLTTGYKAPEAATHIAEKAVTEGADTLAKRAEALAGPAPAAGEIGRLVHGADITTHGAGTQAYDDLGKYIETFKPEATNLFLPAVKNELYGTAGSRFATTAEDLTTMNLGKAAEAFTLIENGINSKNFLIKNPATGVAQFDMANVGAIKSTLNQLERAADGRDRVAVKRIKTGFDTALNDAFAKNLFNGNAQALTDFRAADALWRKYKVNFHDRTGPSAGTFKKALDSMMDQQLGKMPQNLPGAAAETANGILTTGLLNKTYGTDLYNRMARALNNNPAALATVKNEMRNIVLANPSDVKEFTKSIDNFLKNHSGPNGLANKIFDKPGELADLRRLSETAKIIDAKPGTQQQKYSMLVGAAKELTKKSTSGLIGFAFAGLPGALKGLAAGKAAEGVAIPIANALARRAEAAGAPKTYRKAPKSMRVFDQAPDTGSIIRNIPAMEGVGVPGYQEPTMLPPLTIRRASGGRVSDRLVSAVERAKKTVNNSTKALLNVDDSHVARALEIANQNFEG
jgi:hypothetical protein